MTQNDNENELGLTQILGSVCPACGKIQPDDTHCNKCGIRKRFIEKGIDADGTVHIYFASEDQAKVDQWYLNLADVNTKRRPSELVA